MATPGMDIKNLPADPAACHALIRELLEQIHKQRRRLEQLLKARFGPRADRLTVDPNQMFLFALSVLGLKEAPEKEKAPSDSPSPRRRGHGRRLIPADLPRRRVEHDVPEEKRTCLGCGQKMVCIGEDVSEQLEYEPASVFVIEHAQKKYACRPCEDKVVTAEKPLMPIEKGLAGPGLLAHVVVSKYADHLPLYRQEGILERHGVLISRQTMCDWAVACADFVLPIVERMKEEVLKGDIIQTDDTPVTTLDDPNGHLSVRADPPPARPVFRHTGRQWVYRGDEGHPYIVFDFTPSRARDGPVAFLGPYRGYLQADAYRGYDGIFASPLVIEVACWAHGRRYFVDAQSSDPVRATMAVLTLKELYKVEDEAKAHGLDPPAILVLRQEKSKPILDAFKLQLEDWRQEVLPKSPMGEAIHYALSNWTALGRYLEDGRLSIDNNAAERELRSIAVGRNNWLFYGSDRGGKTAAVLMSLIRTCKRHGIDPFFYLRDVFARIGSHPMSRIDELLPNRWKAEHDVQRAAADPHATTDPTATTAPADQAANS